MIFQIIVNYISIALVVLVDSEGRYEFTKINLAIVVDKLSA